MNRRVCVWVGSLLGAAGGAGLSPLVSAAPPAVPIAAVPPAVVAAQSSPAAASASAVITAFVNAQLVDLLGDNVLRQKSAHLSLVAACPRLSGSVPTTSYYDVYANLLSAAGVAKLKAVATPLRVKVSLGMIANEIAVNDPSDQLAPLVTALLADPNPAVALRGTIAARALVQAMILKPGNPALPPLLKALVDSVELPQHKSSPFDGFIADGAFRAMLFDPRSLPGTANPAAAIALFKPLYDPVLDLIEKRTRHYDGGMVQLPDAEQNAPVMFSRDFTLLTPAQQKRSMQALLNLIDAAGQRCVLIPAKDAATLAQLRLTIRNAAQALDVIFNGLTGRASDPLKTLATLPPGSTAQQISAASATAFAGLVSAPQVAALLVRPPALPPIK